MSGLTPESSAIRTTPDIERRLSECTNSEQIKAIMAEAALAQGLVTLDALNPSVMIPTELANHASQAFAKTLMINGQKFIVESPTEDGLVAAELEKMREIFGQSDASQDQARDANTGRFVSKTDKEQEESEQVRLAELERSYKTGAITLDDYLVQSGAVDRVIQKRQQEQTATVNDWTEATSTFLERHRDWQGGDKNRDIISQIVIENRWLDRDPLEALEAAYRIAQEQGRLVENPEVVAQQRSAALQQKIAECTDPNELRALLGYTGVAHESGIWGR